MQKYEIEIKSLLGSKENAIKLRTHLQKKGFDLNKVKVSNQLNHYFTYNSQDVIEKIKHDFLNMIAENKKDEFEKILTDGKDFSIRTRESNGKVILVIKASLDAGTSSNGVSRIEFEDVLQMSLKDLDNKLLECGFTYQAKWSRFREEFGGFTENGNITVCLDKNAGYGYLAEFEKVTENKNEVENIKNDLIKFMEEVECVELQQDRLARMFDFYNKNWNDYYGTEKIFSIE